MCRQSMGDCARCTRVYVHANSIYTELTRKSHGEARTWQLRVPYSYIGQHIHELMGMRLAQVDKKL